MSFRNSMIYAIILNYNSANESVALFKNLEVQQYNYLRILVIDNNSNEEDQIQLRENIPSVNLIFIKKNLGYAGGNNIGIEIALNKKADYVWILNPDIRVNNLTLPILLKTISEDKTLAAVGPRIIHRNNPDKIFSDGGMLAMTDSCSTYHKSHNFEVVSLSGNIDFDIDYIDGSCILLNCEAIKEIGKLPEEYFLYFEETDWCFKARKHNFRLAINSYVSVSNLTSIKNALYHYYMLRNRILFSKKYHPNPIKVRNYYSKALLKEVLFRLKGVYFKPFYLSRVKGLLAGIMNTNIN
tara:strand:+ start:8926 stop:9816 length:891 start_codon:yes stop_codon:yes gene_type:complete